MKAYIPSSVEDRELILESLGLQSVMELFKDIPEELLSGDLQVPEALSEMELWQFLESLGEKNTVFKDVWRGAGSYKHYIPAIVEQITAKERFMTSYTPYQAEISQGILQSIFEFQTSICELTGLEVSNASLYDGASSLAEACRMAVSRKKNKVLLLGHIHPHVLQTVESYYFADTIVIEHIEAGDDGLVDLEALATQLTDDVAGICFQQPNYLGLIEDQKAIIDFAKSKDLLSIVSINPAVLGILEAPGTDGADIVVGEGQSMGIPLSFGGPYVGFMATTEKLKRQLPGRIVGETIDRDGKRAYVLTLQAREQHIRREKAQSNVCTNQALCAMQVSTYLNTIGAEGLERQGAWSFYNAHKLEEALRTLGFSRVHEAPFFNEFLTTTPISAQEIENLLEQEGILSGLVVSENEMLWCATELNTEAALTKLIKVLRKGI